MSEYQYCEFRAIDRPLTNAQMASLRAITSRAEITPTRLTNVYHFGDFKGDPVELLVSHFDAHLYEANWGTHTLMFGFPRKAVDPKTLQPFEIDSDYESGLLVLDRGDRVIVTFASHQEDYEGWIDEQDSRSWLPAMVSLRSDMLNGDLRALYLGWLAGASAVFDAFDATEGDLDEDDPSAREIENRDLFEPPVPPGLGQLTPPLRRLASFLRLDRALIDAAAERSTPLKETGVAERAIRAWLADIPSREKDALLLRLIKGEAQVGAELVRRLRADLGPKDKAEVTGERRTIGDLARLARDRVARHGERAGRRDTPDDEADL